MKHNLSRQTKSFIILFVIAFVGAYTCLIAAKYTDFPGSLTAIERLQLQYYQNSGDSQVLPTPAKNDKVPTDSPTSIDTSKWPVYADSTYNFSIRYPAQWKIKQPSKLDGFYVLTIDPGARYFNVKIYVSPQGYFAMDNLPSTTTMIAGEMTKDVEGVLYGLKHGDNYFTFDQGISQSIKPNFEAMVKSLSFN